MSEDRGDRGRRPRGRKQRRKVCAFCVDKIEYIDYKEFRDVNSRMRRNINERGKIMVLDMGKPVRILHLAERMIQLAGFKPYIDAESWVGVEVKHTLDGNGLTTQIQLESLIDFSEA